MSAVSDLTKSIWLVNLRAHNTSFFSLPEATNHDDTLNIQIQKYSNGIPSSLITCKPKLNQFSLDLHTEKYFHVFLMLNEKIPFLFASKNEVNPGRKIQKLKEKSFRRKIHFLQI